jgi:hypothetical protein
LLTAAVVVAATAHLRARRVSRRLDRLSESYWELRYEYGQLSARLARLEGGADAPESGAALGCGAGTPAREQAPANFVPLSSLKR